MKCQNEDKCDGDLGEEGIDVMVGCSSFKWAFSCNKCGRLHFLVGSPPVAEAIINRQGHRAFLTPEGVVNRDDAGIEQSRW